MHRTDPIPTDDSPKFSPGVDRAYQVLGDHIHSAVDAKPDGTLANIVHDFIGATANAQLSETATLLPIARRLEDGLTSKNAKRALAAYGGSIGFDSPEYQYTTDILSDFAVINRYESDLAKTWHEQETDDELKPVFGDLNSNTQVIDRAWNVDLGLSPFDGLASLAKDINLESMLLRSCELLKDIGIALIDLEAGRGIKDQQVLRLIFLAESTYIPFCEIMGYDALGAALVSNCYLVRAFRLGRKKAIEDARQDLARLGTREDVEQLLSDMPNQVLGESISVSVINRSSDHEMVFKSGFMHIVNLYFDGEVRIVSRLKTLGSLWKKIDREGRLPADLVGLTVIVEDREDLPGVFRTLISNLTVLKAANRVEFVAAPSRNQSINIKAKKDLIDNVSAEINKISDLDVHKVEHNTGYEAAKVTIKWKYTRADGVIVNVPIEIQCHHEMSRSESRHGVDSHVIFKYFKLGGEKEMSLDDAVKAIQELYARKERMVPTNLVVNGASRARGVTLRSQIDQVAKVTPSAMGRVASWKRPTE